MNLLKLAGVIGATVCLVLPITAESQTPGFTVDEELAKRGLSVWGNQGCWMCHRIGPTGSGSGPNLQGLLERRTVDWVSRFLKDATMMGYTDSTVQALAAQYEGNRMPRFKLSRWDITAVIHYIAQQDHLLTHPDTSQENR
jgi:cytochrome c2